MTLAIGAGTLALLTDDVLENALRDLVAPTTALAAIWSTEVMLRRSNVRVLTLDDETEFRPGSPGFPGSLRADDVYDARDLAVIQGENRYVFVIGEENIDGPPRQSFVGGKVTGIKSLDYTRRTWKDGYDGTGLQLRAADWVVFDGYRARNVLDGFRPLRINAAMPLLWRASNMWCTGVRDDGIETTNDGGLLEDSLFDRCFTFYSGQQSATYQRRGTDAVYMRNVLARLRVQPEVRAGQQGVDAHNLSLDANGDGHGWLLKDAEITPLHFTDCVFCVERYSVQGTAVMDLARHPETTYERCTLVWLGDEVYSSFLFTPTGGATGGTYTLRVAVDGGPWVETASIAYNASQSTIRDRLWALPNVGQFNTLLIPHPTTAGVYQVTFGSALDGLDVVLAREDNNLTGGAAPDVVITPIGSYPIQEPLPAGVTLVTDEAAWDEAVAEWTRRHGVTDWDHVDEYLFGNPLEA